MSSSISDVSTPGISGVTSGEQFVIPLPADDRMAAATLTALETCSLTPLIKEELKYTIQSRRLAAGKPELVVDTSIPVRQKKVMTAEEKERALKRREQNRMAAQRFRQKQKDTADVLLRKCQRMEGSNTTLRAEIRRLARECQELRQLLTSHLLVCPKVKVAR
ncbi:cyclic AMP-dependent transcription factor ATF-3-like [Babylonia areolata]|uniref:cyclic AMP-dependent transcription factor ATF-3-like n=1 Tax=Babylonia areolata TaxID=304850 RepID=UPI003FD11B9F